ncbi:MAG: MFS transporter [Phycisphaerales bacterium]|nr:MAG: MFS transporter [Phycisphaerales bacterium]
MSPSTLEKVHAQLTGEDDGRVCRDIPEEACRHQPKNFFLHVASLALTKGGDSLVDPKLVLSWLLPALGAPTAMVGLLVPIREAGSLLPQLITAGAIRRLPQRKWAWAAGSLVQGLAAAGIGLVAIRMEGAAAGWAILALLAVFAVARSVCSVSYKDVLGKTVSKSTRGTTTGSAATVGGLVALLFGLALLTGLLPLEVPVIAGALFVAAGFWLAAATMFTSIAETAGATEGGGTALRVAIQNLKLLKTDAQLRRFIYTRALLTATALAPPFLLITSFTQGDDRLARLGPFVIASALAAMLSTYVWGRLADRSSRVVLARAGLIGAVAVGAGAIAGSVGLPEALGVWVYPALLFIVMIAHQGVRIGRATHLVDMATPDTRLAYTAISNTTIGLILVLGGAFAIVESLAGPALVLAMFAAMALAAAFAARGLEQVQ